MKIEIQVKDNPRGFPTVKATMDQSVHRGLTVAYIASVLKKQYPWAKIIDIRVDLR